MSKRYKTKPVEIEAVQWTGNNLDEIKEFCGDAASYWEYLMLSTLEGNTRASVGDYIIKGLRGEFYPCNYDAFHAKYEEIHI